LKHGDREASLYVTVITCRLLQTIRGMKQCIVAILSAF